MSAYVVVSTTVEREDEANRLAEAVIEARLAACVQILPVRSVYRWQNKVERAAEALLQMKTRSECVQPLMQFVRDRHAYDVPELTVTKIEAGSEDYLGWISEETQQDGHEQ